MIIIIYKNYEWDFTFYIKASKSSVYLILIAHLKSYEPQVASVA